ncbi:MAG TPA: hypothetical protein VFC54_05345 [Pseudolabrys sp.]|nr:hypothetical protein [Pseudolabrys sp.]
MQNIWRKEWLFITICVLGYCAAVLIVPPYTPLIEPDSKGYIDFDPLRSAFYPAFLYLCRAAGLSLVQTTWVQLAIFGAALGYLLSALRRIDVPRYMLAALVLLLAANVLFSSFHRSILTESLYFSGTAVLLGLWLDYFRSGQGRFLFLAGLILGLMIGVRPAGIGVVPMQLLAAWLRRPPQMISKWLMVALAVAPVMIGAGSERVLYRAVHVDKSESTTPNLLIGMAAMLVQPNMKFTGPRAQTLTQLSTRLDETYGPTQKYLADAPTISVRVQLSAAYQALSQFRALASELVEAAKKENTTPDALRAELGKQIVSQNISGYVRLMLVNYFGQWCVAVRNFPPTARRLAEYANTNPSISLGGQISHAELHPRPTIVGLVVYPAFLVAGAVTLALTAVFLFFVWSPSLMNSPEGFYLGIAVFLAAMCQGYTLFISLINEWTPRFLMAVFPQLEIVAMCLTLIILHRCGIITLRRPSSAV